MIGYWFKKLADALDIEAHLLEESHRSYYAARGMHGPPDPAVKTIRTISRALRRVADS